MDTTQKHLQISDIKDDLCILKNGGGALILQVSAVNFGLLSNREQMAIIFAFAQMLNSLSYSIQIVIRSERLNVSSYLSLLDKAKDAQTNALLSEMILNYREFIQNTIKENEVLDKQFYVVIPLFSLELGLIASKENLEQKIKTILLPRRDQLIRQLQRVGLKATQLTSQKLIELFYDIYNSQFVENIPLTLKPDQIDINLKKPQKIIIPDVPGPAMTGQPASPAQLAPRSERGEPSKTHPFVVEELEG